MEGGGDGHGPTRISEWERATVIRPQTHLFAMRWVRRAEYSSKHTRPDAQTHCRRAAGKRRQPHRRVAELPPVHGTGHGNADGPVQAISHSMTGAVQRGKTLQQLGTSSSGPPKPSAHGVAAVGAAEVGRILQPRLVAAAAGGVQLSLGKAQQRAHKKKGHNGAGTGWQPVQSLHGAHGSQAVKSAAQTHAQQHRLDLVVSVMGSQHGLDSALVARFKQRLVPLLAGCGLGWAGRGIRSAGMGTKVLGRRWWSTCDTWPLVCLVAAKLARRNRTQSRPTAVAQCATCGRQSEQYRGNRGWWPRCRVIRVLRTCHQPAQLLARFRHANRDLWSQLVVSGPVCDQGVGLVRALHFSACPASAPSLSPT